jgi:hypothetical protein
LFPKEHKLIQKELLEHSKYLIRSSKLRFAFDLWS